MSPLSVHAQEEIENFDASKKVVCFVHGLGFSLLEVSFGSGRNTGRSGCELAYVGADCFSDENKERAVENLAIPPVDCQSAATIKGVHVKVVEGLKGISSLSPNSHRPADHWKGMIDALSADFFCCHSITTGACGETPLSRRHSSRLSGSPSKPRC